MWDVDYSRIEPWLDAQDEKTVAHVFAALELLKEYGPNLGRPLVDTLKGARHGNLKELRPASLGDSEIRIIFVFDVKRNAVMLLAGDKSKGASGRLKWSGWYRRAIPQAERIYDDHLRSLEGRDVRPGGVS